MRFLTKGLLLLAPLVLSLSARADTFVGAVDMSDQLNLNGVAFVANFDHPTFSFTTGTTYLDNFTITPINLNVLGGGGTDSLYINLGFLFPNLAGASIGGSGTSNITLSGNIFHLTSTQSNSLSWDATINNPIILTFTDGSKLEAYVLNAAQSWNGSGAISNTLVFQSIAATPEPSSIMLMGTGLLGIAGVMRRKFVA